MAARDNTALHAALIIMVLLTVLLAGMTYLFFGKSEEANKAKNAAQEQYASAQSSIRTLNSELRVLKFMVGWDQTLTMADVEGEVAALGDQNAAAKQFLDAFKLDLKRFGEGLQGSPNYRQIPEHLLAVLKSKNDQLAAALAQQRVLETNLRDVTQREVARAKDFEKNAQKAADDLAAQIAAHDQERNKWNSEKDDLKSKIAGLGTQINQTRSDADREKKLANDQVIRAKRDYDIVRTELERYRTHENFEIPDGVITQVNQKTGTVFVNIGLADGLRKQVGFSVYDRNENSATKAQKKAGIEITRVIDEHNSEGRIVHASNTNPILPGDQVYSPVWTANRFVHFALTPWIDIDDDARNDHDFVQALIERHNGKIDPPNAMSVKTRYLVDINDLPGRNIVGDQIEDVRKVRNAMRTQAQELGIKIVHVNELLEWMGVGPQDKTVSLGVSSSAEAAGRGKNADGFRERQPPPR